MQERTVKFAEHSGKIHTNLARPRGQAQCVAEVLLDGVEPVVPPVVPLMPEFAAGAALVEPVVAPLVAPLVLLLVLVLFVAPAPMPVALRVAVISVDFIDVLVVDWQPAASAAARQRPNTAAGRRVDWMLMCDYSLWQNANCALQYGNRRARARASAHC
jgi:hypothetical protein